MTFKPEILDSDIPRHERWITTLSRFIPTCEYFQSLRNLTPKTRASLVQAIIRNSPETLDMVPEFQELKAELSKANEHIQNLYEELAGEDLNSFGRLCDD